MHQALSRADMLGALAAVAGVRPSTIRSLALTDQAGRQFTLANAGHRVTALTFIATRCTDTCPLSEALFATLAREIRRERIDAGLVMLTLDPAYDTPFVLARRAMELDAAAPAFRLAWAPAPAMREIERAFGVEVAFENGIPDAHTALIYVLDAGGSLARTFPLSNRPADVLAALRAAR
jgi:protein SCO1/2